jgi:cation:H+ antiporter
MLTGIAILWSGTKIAYLAIALAEKTGLGQAIVGAVFVGISTSLSGSILSITAAANNHPDLAISNAIGGIAVQTLFLAIADMTYRKANLEHASASIENIAQASLLIILLILPLLAALGPPVTVLQTHPFSLLLLLSYIGGMYIVSKVKSAPMWEAVQTSSTQTETEAAHKAPGSLKSLLLKFWILVLVLALSGFAMAQSATALADKTGLSETIIGGFLTSTVTSLPELVTALAAVRRGALNLAIGDIIGGNIFDVLFLSFSDIAYRQGSVYHAFNDQHFIIILVSIMMASVLIFGLIRREQFGPAGIGFESTLVLLIYLCMTASFFL